MDDKLLVESLIQSCSRQLARYRELDVVSQKVLSQVVLSRGGVSGVTAALGHKQKIMEEISAERAASQPLVELWQVRKSDMPPGARTDFLNTILDNMQKVITAVLDKEDQLSKYFERAVHTARVPGVSHTS